MSLNNKVIKECDFGGRTITVETGRMAKQADGAVLVTYGETVVLVTATSAHRLKTRARIFPPDSRLH